MANFDTIKAAIDANINTNGKQEITGGKMNSILKQMVDATDSELTELDDAVILLGIEKGGIDIESGNLFDSELRARTSSYINAPFSLLTKPPFIVRAVLRYEKMGNSVQFVDAEEVFQREDNNTMNITDKSYVYKVVFSNIAESTLIDDASISEIVKAFYQGNIYRNNTLERGKSTILSFEGNDDIFSRSEPFTFVKKGKWYRLFLQNTSFERPTSGVIFEILYRNLQGQEIALAGVYNDDVIADYYDVRIPEEDFDEQYGIYVGGKTTLGNMVNSFLEEISDILFQTELSAINFINGDWSPSNLTVGGTVVRTNNIEKLYEAHIDVGEGESVKILEHSDKYQTYRDWFVHDVDIIFESTKDYVIMVKNNNGSILYPENMLTKVIITYKPNVSQNVREVSSNIITSAAIDNIRRDLQRNILFKAGKNGFYFSADTGKGSLNEKTVAELYDKMDELVNIHPSHFARNADLGKDASGQYVIREYTLGFRDVLLRDDENSLTPNLWDSHYERMRNHIILIGGVHGNEKSPCWGQYLALKEILESDESWAKYIRANVVLHIIPCVNPWGFNNNNRRTSQIIDIARDMTTFSATESQILKRFIDTYGDYAIAFIDTHGTQGYQAYYEPNAKDVYYYDIMRLMAAMASAIQDNWAEFWANNATSGASRYPYLKGVASPFVGVTSEYVAQHYQIPAIITETPDNLRNGLINDNRLESCKITKDLTINTIMSLI